MTLNEKAKDLRSSGYALTVCGGLGIIAMIMIFTGVIPLSMGGAFGIVTKGVMTLLFVLFFAAGVHSFKRSKTVSQDAVRETDKKNEIKKWFIENFDAEALDSMLNTRQTVKEETETKTEAEAETEAEEETGAEAKTEAEEDDDGPDDGGEKTENDLYFERTDLIKDKICERFMDIEDALMSELTEELYSELFEAGR